MVHIDLVEAERQSFRAATDTGLWDIMIAAVACMFAIAPLLSVHLGDFWSSAVFLPLWIAVYLGLRLVQKRVVAPRVGTIRISRYRQRRLRRVGWVLLGVNVIALAAGIFAATRPVSAGPWRYAVTLGMVLLAGFSLAAYYLDVPRYMGYGLGLLAAPALGEWLFQQGLASHHGYPIVFGAAAIILTLGGTLRFVRAVPFHGRPREGAASGEDR